MLFQTAPHPCGYWSERTARDVVFDPGDPRAATRYPAALSLGFRRSGDLIYRPYCLCCRACQAVRVPVDQFHADRSQRRCLKQNSEVVRHIAPAIRTPENFALYQRYLNSRHPDGGMQNHGPYDFDHFLLGRWASTRFMELRERRKGQHSRLLAVAVTDRIPTALSAVYTFYEPELVQRGLGTLAILHQIDWARQESRQFLYLGYWIDGHPKMDYKRRFRPQQRFDGRQWNTMD